MNKNKMASIGEEKEKENNANKEVRIPTIEEVTIKIKEDKTHVKKDTFKIKKDKFNTSDIEIEPVFKMKPSNFMYKNLGNIEGRNYLKTDYSLYNYCLFSVAISFALGLLIGMLLMGPYQPNIKTNIHTMNKRIDISHSRNLNSLKRDIEYVTEKNRPNKYNTVTFTGTDAYKSKQNIYPKGLTEDMRNILKDNKDMKRVNSIRTNNTFIPNKETVLYDNIFWGPEVEDSMPQGYGENSAELWESYVSQNEVVKMENGCGRMQNRLVTFQDGVQACVRYRQNTDQIQGEIFSFYVAKLLNLTNLAPSVVKVVDMKDKLWKNVANEIGNAQWSTNRAVVLTQFIPSLEGATIPDVFKPANRHLNKKDVLEISLKENRDSSKDILIEKLKTKELKLKNVSKAFDHINMKLNKKTVNRFVELAQWSDLIIFDYLTANLDRIVNNLFNFQWNINIMDGPAHNLARKMDSGLLLFLDNESGLLHGYRLLKKYNVYHSMMLENLCVFRKTTINALKNIFEHQNVGAVLSDMFHRKNNAIIKDILPPLPEKNAKILLERIGKVLAQVEKCQTPISER